MCDYGAFQTISTWSWRRTQKIFVHTRLLISLRVSFCRNKEEKQKFSTATMVRLYVIYQEVNYTVEHLFGRFSHYFVENFPMTWWTILPRRWGQFLLGNDTFRENTLFLWWTWTSHTNILLITSKSRQSLTLTMPPGSLHLRRKKVWDENECHQ